MPAMTNSERTALSPPDFCLDHCIRAIMIIISLLFAWALIMASATLTGLVQQPPPRRPRDRGRRGLYPSEEGAPGTHARRTAHRSYELSGFDDVSQALPSHRLGRPIGRPEVIRKTGV